MARKRKKRTPFPPRERKHLTTAQEVVTALGGLDVVRRITDCRHKTSIHNWIAWGCFPARYYKVMNDALAELGLTAPHALWDQRGDHEPNGIAA